MTFQVTNDAKAHLAEMIETHKLPEEAAIRFVQEGNGVQLKADQKQEGDVVFEHDDRAVLLLDQPLAEVMDGQVLDLVESEAGEKQLSIQPVAGA